MSNIAQLNVRGYDITVDFSYTPGTEDSLEQPGDPEELVLNSWWFTDEQQAESFVEDNGADAFTSDWFLESIITELWDYVRNYGASDDYYEDDGCEDYLHDADDLDW